MTVTDITPPIALTMQTKDVPWAIDVLAPGMSAQLLVADVEAGLTVANIRFAPGTVIPTHLHTGAVHGYTTSGSWFYREYGRESLNVAGTYIYEPAGSTHTLEAPASNTEDTEALFIIYGAFLNYDEQGNYVGHVDAAVTRQLYIDAIKRQGDTLPDFVIGGNSRYGR
ncbi:2,4'-dihydroxyacetophenone dioxygenase family protein [[Mycobacterium] burgundiense]|uniref:2,4'-dihydroxyacetophenone dioxygenase family protein n=1 Tax=[Mycobacterium] burgundiense TaxID=3064286 RepID=A0ABM9LWY6_9MYCO|nr:2,4'-dihydroxyacetophenone dioxygenase family protein [Mycolicibacterium sp. MU0053]CAJ1506110.1 2,4'-dihydroxyacetophenone dioxygenase family protein [Mycolicibacterium sp. MU0053]